MFHNKKWSIPEIINKALVDQRLWMEANSSSKIEEENSSINQGSQRSTRETVTTTVIEAIHKANTDHCCFVDASWISCEKRAGIRWILMNVNGKPILIIPQ